MSGSGDANDFETMMRELRDEYIKSIPQKIADIEAHLAASKWPDLRNDFHKLKGTGRTYGIPEISTLCEPVEKICLHKPEIANRVVQNALVLLIAIYAERLEQKEFLLEKQAAFIEIRNIAAQIAS